MRDCVIARTRSGNQAIATGPKQSDYGPCSGYMIRLTETREVTPYRWAHPDEER
jgi:hypothetical protein